MADTSTATKTKNPDGSYSTTGGNTFTLLTDQVVEWTANYLDTPPAGDGFYLNHDGTPPLNEIELSSNLASGFNQGTRFLSAGTYAISINYWGMGKGNYAINYNLTAGISITVASYNFGELLEGDTATQTFTITSTGDKPVTISDVVSDDPGHFEVINKPIGSVVPPNRTFQIRCNAGNVPGYYTATITVTGTSDLGNRSDTLTVSCSVLPREPEIQVSSTSIDFGTLPINIASETRTLVITNIGNVNLSISYPASPAGSAFQWSAHNGNIAPDASHNVTITFTAQNIGLHQAVLTITSNDPNNNAQDIQLSGNGRQPIVQIGFSSTVIDFGKHPVGSSPQESLRIRNDGEVVLNVSYPASPAGSAFQWSAYNGNIAVNGEHQVPITFNPNSEGNFSGILTVSSNDPNSPHSIQLLGDGCIPNAEIVVPSTPFPDFERVEVGLRQIRNIAIRIIGDDSLSITASIEGDPGHLYGIRPASGSVIDVVTSRIYTINPTEACGNVTIGSGCTDIEVVFFANDNPGVYTAELVIRDTGSSTEYARYALSAEIIVTTAVDAGLVIDRSGSMGEIIGQRTKSDAAVSAAQIFAQLIRPDLEERLTIVKFNNIPEVHQEMVCITSSGSPNQASIVDSIENTEAFKPTGSTSIGGGIMVAQDQLAVPRTTIPPTLHKALVVLTDGKDNTAYLQEGTYYSLLGGPINPPTGSVFAPDVDSEPIPLPPEIKIYCIGLGKSENIDEGRLDYIATTTGAYYGVVSDLESQTYFDLEKYFVQVYMDIVDLSVVFDPIYTIYKEQVQQVEFNVQPGDVSALIVIYSQSTHLPFHLVTPSGEHVKDNYAPPGYRFRIGATPTARFMEVFMPVGEPDRYAGSWKIVISHIGMVAPGTALLAREKRSMAIAYPSSYTFLAKNYKKWDDPVNYSLTIGVKSNLRMTPAVSANILKMGDPIQLRVAITEVGLPISGWSITAKIVSPSGKIWRVPLQETGNLDYSGQFIHTNEAGSYSLTYYASGRSLDGQQIIQREQFQAKYIEGRKPILPVPDCTRERTYLRRLNRYLLIIIILLVLLSLLSFIEILLLISG
ncbi:MAG: choice-of-anchor D domain-containing protein [Candidatus Odinarchaeota archaeon]